MSTTKMFVLRELPQALAEEARFVDRASQREAF